MSNSDETNTENAKLKVKPRRSVLCMPGANTRALEKARTLSCDGIIFDLEDAVAPASKTIARENVCRQGLAMGFDGKTLIHPTQIDIANGVFGVASEEVAHAREVLNVWQAARDAGKGVAELDGQLIENLHAADAERILEFAEALADREG